MSPREANSFVGQEWGLWSGGRGAGAPHAEPGRWPTTRTLWELVLSRGIEGDSVSLSAVSITALLTRPPCCRHSGGIATLCLSLPKERWVHRPNLQTGKLRLREAIQLESRCARLCTCLRPAPKHCKTFAPLHLSSGESHQLLALNVRRTRLLPKAPATVCLGGPDHPWGSQGPLLLVTFSVPLLQGSQPVSAAPSVGLAASFPLVG